MYHVTFTYSEGGSNHLVFPDFTEALNAIAVHYEMGETTSPHKRLVSISITAE